MSLSANEETVALLLWTLSDPVAENLLTRLDPQTAPRLRGRVREFRQTAPPDAAVDAAMREYFDFQRIADRSLPAPRGAGSGRPGDAPHTPAGADAVGTEPTSLTDSIAELKQIDVEKLLRGMQGERPAVIAMVLTLLDASKAGAVLKGLPPELRPEVVYKMSQPAPDTPLLLEITMKAIVEKCRNIPGETKMPSSEDRVKNLAQMLRNMARDERKAILDALGTTDPDLVTRVMSNLYTVEDMLRVEDRSLQTFLQAIDVRTLAGALKGSDEKLMKKVTANLSNRARETLSEEMSMQVNLSAARVKEAQGKFVEVFREFEEQDKLSFIDG